MNLTDKLRSGATSWGLLASALVLGGLAFLAANWYLRQQQEALEQELLGQQGAKRAVVVATMPLAAGETLGGHNMAIAEIASVNLSERAVSPDDFSYYDGQVLRTPMSQGEPLLDHFVAGFGAERFSDLLVEGERAVTIAIDEIKSQDNMLVYGDRVDLLLLMEPESRSGGEQDKQKLAPLVENVRVLAIGRRALVSRDADFAPATDDPEADASYSTLTVGVPMQDASRLLLARDLGEIVVALRNRKDESPLRSDLLTGDGLLSRSGGEGSYLFYSNGLTEGGALKPAVQAVDKLLQDATQAAPAAPAPAQAPAEPAAASGAM